MEEVIKETPLEKRAKILDYMFEHIDEYTQPKDVKKKYKLNSNAHRTLIRNFQWFHLKYVIYSQQIIESIEGNYDTKYKINPSDKINFKIPSDKLQRLNYATVITSLLMNTESDILSNTLVTNTIEILNKSIKEFMSGIIRDTFLSVNVYDYFKNKKGSMLSILMELSHFNQQISLKIKSEDSMTQIDKTIIKKVTINEDGSIKLKLPNMSIKLKSLDEITNIFILSKNYPTTKSGSPLMNKKTFIESIKKNDNIGKMRESFVKIMGDLQSEIEDEVDMDFDKYVENLLKDKVDGLNIIERGNRRIKTID